MRSGHHGFQDVLRAVHAARNRQVRPDPPVKNGNPAQPQQQLGRAAQGQAGHDFESFNVKIRLVKAIEENQSVRAGRVQLFAHVCDRAEEVRKLHRDRNTDVSFDLSYQIAVVLLNVSADNVGIGNDGVDVQFD